MEKYMPENNGGTRIPQTIEELKAFCAEKGMPLDMNAGAKKFFEESK